MNVRTVVKTERKARAHSPAKVQGHCLQDAAAASSRFPETLKTALFAFDAESLDESERAALERLFEADAGYRDMVEDMRRNRKWLAPQYGLQ